MRLQSEDILIKNAKVLFSYGRYKIRRVLSISEDRMTASNNINRIGNLYRQWQPLNNCGAPQPGEDKPLAVAPVDRVTLSAQTFKEDSKEQDGARNLPGEQELDNKEKQQVNNLKKRDTEVKAHEQAHMASGGGIVQGGATYEYQTGPDGKMYAVGGEVKIDLSPESSPEATIRKMQQVRRAALAPSEPSGTDRAVAAQASQIEAQARMEKTNNGSEGEDAKHQTIEYAFSLPRTANEPTAYQSTPETRGRRIDLVA
jgi:hypothetical protein